MNRPEPAVIAAAVKEMISNLIKLLVVFAVIKVTAEQFGMLMIFIDSAMAVIMVLFIRQNVTPVASPQVEEGTIIRVTDKDTGELKSEKVA